MDQTHLKTNLSRDATKQGILKTAYKIQTMVVTEKKTVSKMPRNFPDIVQPARFPWSDESSYLEEPVRIRRHKNPDSSRRNLNVRFEIQDGCPSKSCVGESVLEIFKRQPSCYTFREACGIFIHLRLDNHLELIRSTILNYSLKVYGLPECQSKDLYLAVYFFIEDVFGMECKLELCVGLVENDDPNVIGIVLDSIDSKRRILKKAMCLEGTGIKIRTNFDLDWILNGLCCSDKF